MIVLSNTSEQVVQPGETIQLPVTVFKRSRCCCSRYTASSVKLCEKGIYYVHFNGNVGGGVQGEANIAIAVGGEPRLETRMIATDTGSTTFNVAAGTIINNCCCDMDRISVKNIGNVAFTLSPNPALTIYKIG